MNQQYTPSLSVIIPIYNKACYLPKCLDSILGQNYVDFEVILIDDGSQDNSYEIVKSYMAKDSRIHGFSFSNGGVSAARNRGIERCAGEYMLFIDSDDWIDDDYFETIMNAQKRYMSDILLWGLIKEYDDGKREFKNPSIEGLFDLDGFFSQMVPLHYTSQIGILGYVPNKLVRTEIVKKNGLHFNPAYKLQEDLDFFIQCYKHSTSFACIPYCGYHYVAGTAYSSGVTSSTVDYVSLLEIQEKMLELMESVKNKKLRFSQYSYRALSDLSIAAFLELRNVSYKQVNEIMLQIRKLKYTRTALRMCCHSRFFLKYSMLYDITTVAFLYTWLWNIYVKIRQK